MRIGWKSALGGVALLAAAAMGAVRYSEWLASFIDANLRVEIPTDLVLETPGPDVPANIAAFAGVWAGDRIDGGALPIALAVESVNLGGWANVAYAWGANQEKHQRHGSIRRRGRIIGGHLELTSPDGSPIDASIGADGRLLMRLTAGNGWRRYALLTRIEASGLAETIARARRRSAPLWEEIAIPERSAVGDAAGRSLSLQATLYRVHREGRQPLIILNPGSQDLHDPGDVVRDEVVARIFLSFGYSVVVPMRKGRGSSGGPMIEGRDYAGPPAPELQIESGIEDIDAVVTYMQRQDFVAPDRIVVAGDQHGGLLAIAYAGRYPDKVAAAIDFAGGWWPTEYRDGRLDTEILAAAGRGMAGRPGGVPTLWLYAESDARWKLPQAERNFAAFREAGGTGRFVAFPDPTAPGIYRDELFDWTAKWETAVADFLGDPSGKGDTPSTRNTGVALLDLGERQGRPGVSAAIFYPSPIAKRSLIVDGATIEAVDRAPVAEGRFPIILVSPAFGGDRFSQHDTAEALARGGFIVVAVTDPGEDESRPGTAFSERAILGRAADLRGALDALLAEPLFAERVDPARIGAIGYGLGGATALLLAGGQPDPARLEELCRPAGEAVCGQRSDTGLAGASDDRVRALALLAPIPGALFDVSGLRAVSLPVRIYRAGGDRSTSTDAVRLGTLLPTPPEEVVIPAARSAVFRPPCTPGERESTPERCIDPPGVHRASVHERIDAELAAFFGRVLPAGEGETSGAVSGR